MNRSIKTAAILALILLVAHGPLAAAVEDYDESMQTALTLRNGNRNLEAAEIYSRIIADNPRDVDALVGRGFCLIRDKKSLADAEADFLAVVRIAPSYVDAYYGLALIYGRSGRWREAEMILETAAEHCSEEDSRDYLADICWKTGHLRLARSIDTRPRGQTARRIKGYGHELYLSFAYDWVEDRPDWQQGGAVYIHHLRPDLNIGVSFFEYRRGEADDSQVGLSLGYRHNINWGFEYHSFFSADGGFLARQKHQPMFSYSFPSHTVVGAGLRLDEYDEGWATVGRFALKQYVRSLYVEYSLQSGHDNFDRPVTTHIAKFGYEGSDRLFAHLGFASGNETIEFSGSSEFSDERIDSLFFNLKYFVFRKGGIIIGGGPEYRDSELFRTTGAVSTFLRF